MIRHLSELSKEQTLWAAKDKDPASITLFSVPPAQIKPSGWNFMQA